MALQSWSRRSLYGLIALLAIITGILWHKTAGLFQENGSSREPTQQRIPFKSTLVKKMKPAQEAQFASDELLIGFVIGTPEREILKWIKPYQLSLIDYNSLSGLAQLKIDKDAPYKDVMTLIEILKQKKNPMVRYIEPNYIVTID